MRPYKFIPLPGYRRLGPALMRRRAAGFREEMARRRTVRHFSADAVPEGVIRDCVIAAASAPSGANLQPWHFVVVQDPSVKKKIREAAEKEEREFYGRRAPEEWLRALEPLGTDADKSFLETAPCLIVIFVKTYGIGEGGRRFKHYYALESVGIATGILITAIHRAGLVSLTHTPSPMGFLNGILGRPANERPFLNLIVGYPAADAVVPDIKRRKPGEIITFT